MMMNNVSEKEEGGKRKRGCLCFWPLLLIPLIPVIFYLLVAFAPQVFFPFSLEHGNFTVHMRSSVPREIEPVLDRVDQLIRKSELYDDEKNYDVYIIDSFKLSRLFLMRNVHFGCTPSISGDIFVVKADIENDIAYCELENENDTRIRTLSETIAHEAAHDMIRKHIGVERNLELPGWVAEGYCEYIAEGSALDVDHALDLVRNEPYAYIPGLFNFRSRLTVTYLLDYKSWTIEELLDSPPDRNSIEYEMLEILSRGDDIIR